MAKKLDVFRKTAGDLDAGNIKSTGVGLREGEVSALDAIGAEIAQYLNADKPIKRNAVMRLAIRKFLEDYQSGALTLEALGAFFEVPEKPQPRLKY